MDECAFNIGGRYGKTYVTRRPGEAYIESCIEPKFQRIETVMIWGCIMGGQKGPLVIWDKKWGTITAQNYISYVLRPQLVPYFQERREETQNYVYFQQDGAPAHRARATTKYLQEEGVFPYIFPWPAGSPDANPIEKLWNLMKQRISVRSPRPIKKDTLIAAIQEEWDRFSALEIGELTASLPARVRAIYDAGGGHTQY